MRYLRHAIGVMLLAGTGRLDAQAVRVRAREEGTNRPAVGALATLRDSTGKALTQALTDGSGKVVLRAPHAGTFQVRIDRIGFSGVTLGPIHLVVGDTLALVASVPNVRRVLPELAVKSGSEASCQLAADASETVAQLWDEARKALTVSELSDSTMAVLEVTRFEREFGPEGSVIADSAHREVVRSNRPFIAADPAKLARIGFREQVGSGFVFYAPDARILLSDEFLAQHCFGPAGTPPDSGLVGLAFSPGEKYRKRTDVTGTLWLDRATSELRRIDFQYTNVDKRIASGKESGRMELVRLPRGEVIVGRWRVRVGFMERGGEVAVIRGEGSGDRAWVVGLVFDSLGNHPLGGVVVRTSAGSIDTTRADGTYRLSLPSSGSFTVEVDHPLLAMLDAPRTFRSEVQMRGQEIVADFASPSSATLTSRVCARRKVDLASESLLFGEVVDSTGHGQTGSIQLEWDRVVPLRAGYRLSIVDGMTRLVVPVDSAGRFWACGVPGGLEIRVRLPSATADALRATVPTGQAGYLRLVNR